MSRSKLRRIIVTGIVLVMLLPAVLAADMAERAASGPLVVRYAGLNIGDVYTFDVSFSSKLHGLDEHVDDYMVIRVEGLEDGPPGPDGQPQRAVVLSKTVRLTVLDELASSCSQCPDTTGEQTERWWLRVPDGIVIRRDTRSETTEWRVEDGERLRRDVTRNTTVLEGRLGSSALGTRAPDRPFVDAPATLRPFIASFWAETAEEVDVDALLDGDDGTISARGEVEGRAVHRVYHEETSGGSGVPLACTLPFPGVGYRDYRSIFGGGHELGYSDRRSRDAHAHEQLSRARTSALWMSPDYAFPLVGTCAAQYHNTTTGALFEDITFRIQLADHEPGNTPVRFDWDPHYQDNNPAHAPPPIAKPQRTRLAGAPSDDGAGLLLPLDRAVRHLETTDDARVRDFRDDDTPFHVVELRYQPGQTRNVCTLPVDDMPLPVPVSEEAECWQTFVSWILTLMNRANETIDIAVEQDVDGRLLVGEPRVTDDPTVYLGQRTVGVRYHEIATELVSLGDATRHWTGAGLLDSDWQEGSAYVIQMDASHGRTPDLRLIYSGHDAASGPHGRPSHEWSSGIDATTGAPGDYSEAWYGPEQQTLERPPLTGTSATSAPVDVHPHTAVAATVTASTVLLALVTYLLWPLLQKTALFAGYAKLRRDKLLEHPVRSEMHAYLDANPGATTSDIRKALDLAQGTATHHLAKLKEHGVVRDATAGGNRIWTLTESGAPEPLDALLKRPAVARVWDAIVASPGSTQRDLVARLGVAKTSIQAHTARLVEVGALDIKREGRSVQYWPRPPNP